MAGLTPEEHLEISAIDARCAELDLERKDLTRKRMLIQQRGNQRALYRARKETA
jgi:hypothetical protein